MRKSLLLLLFCVSCALTARAGAQFIQQRFLPPNGERARLGEAQPLPIVKVGNRLMRLAPGGVIYDQNNRSIVHAHVPPYADVYYTKDLTGNILRIYILTEQERARLDQAGKR